MLSAVDVLGGFVIDMRDLKYIIVKPKGLEARAIVFNGMFNHSDIWLGAKKSFRECKLISAGFVIFESYHEVLGQIVKTYGGSESLTKLLDRNVLSLDDDNFIIEDTINRRHIM